MSKKKIVVFTNKLKNILDKDKSIIISFFALIVSVFSVFYSYKQNVLLQEQILVSAHQNEIAEQQLALLYNESDPNFQIYCSEKLVNPVYNENEKYKELPTFEILNIGKECKIVDVNIALYLNIDCDSIFSIQFVSPYNIKYLNDKQLSVYPENEDFWINLFNNLYEDTEHYKEKYGKDIRFNLSYLVKLEYIDVNNQSQTKYWVRSCNGGFGTAMVSSFCDLKTYQIYSSYFPSFICNEKVWYRIPDMGLDDLILSSKIYGFFKDYPLIDSTIPN